MSEKEKAVHQVTVENMWEILGQSIGLEEVFVRMDGKANTQGRTRSVCYVRWPTVRRILMEVDPQFELKAVQTSLADPGWFETFRGRQRFMTPQVHYFAVRELTLHVWDEARGQYVSITRSGCGEDNDSPKAAETDANKRAGFNFDVANMLFDDKFYVDLGLPGSTFFCKWPQRYFGGVPLSTVLHDEKSSFQPGDATKSWVRKPSAKKDEEKEHEELQAPELDPVKEKLLQVSSIGQRLQIPISDVRQYLHAVFGVNSSAELSSAKVDKLLETFEKLTTRAQFGQLLDAVKDK